MAKEITRSDRLLLWSAFIAAGLTALLAWLTGAPAPLWFYFIVWILVSAGLWRGLLKQTALENIANLKDKQRD